MFDSEMQPMNMSYSANIGDERQLNMTVSIIFYIIQWLLFFPTLYVNFLVIRMTNRESLSINLELRSISMIYIASSIFSLIYQGMIKFLFPVSLLIGDWFCQTTNVFMSAVLMQQLFSTFSISIYRYVFIVHGEKYTQTNRIQRNVTWTIFIGKSVVLFFLTAKYIIFDPKYLFVKFWTGVCNGDILKDDMNGMYNSTVIEYIVEGFIHVRSEEHYSVMTIFGNVENQFCGIVLRIICVIISLITFLTCSNLTEGIMYYKIAKFWKG